MIDLIEITIQSGIERTEVLLFPNKNIAYIDDKKIGITEQDINNILDITKVEAGKLVRNNAPYSLADLIAKLSHITKINLTM